ncbi:hypothetical protein IU436_17050 [Nocardia farcinica]|uniref:hypothetical protein n=1 Tax=Nocardia farcinica TaxID=37329 RepID=UPI00189544AB|nr:hypothetical protein [Nocardia farcinica]MBF6231741.1 hypothetical protein [Nocardia farcinica]MBF6252051.1 hypothetical protein [Nocardia farcinica]MBF6375750.1 hypothetical protein [Nocardia farcinica]MBF6420822.1 hypothetical protein [Nocardia farcinica]MBF6432066.1 hypothetical protein [Nocardia farcinica]
MSAPATRSAAVPGRTLAVLGALGALSVVAFVLAPAAVAARTAGGGFGDEAAVRAAFRAAFTGYWNSGSRDLPPDTAHLVEFWSHYHLVKALAAVAALIAFAAMAVLVWQALARTGRHRAALRTAGVLATALAAVAAVLTLANVQGALAPLASLLPMLVDEPADQALAGTLAQVRSALADAATAPPALAVMVEDFARYHRVLAVLAGGVAVALIGASIESGRRFAAGRHRPVTGTVAVSATAAALVATVVAVANTTNAADPAAGLAALFTGGW